MGEWNEGRNMVALGLAGFGALGLIYADFGMVWQSVPAWVPARTPLAYAAGGFEILAAAALLWKPLAERAALVLAVYCALWVLLLDVPPLIANITVEASWLAAGERAELCFGVCALYLTLSGRNGRQLRWVRIAFGLALIPIGLSHLVYPTAVSMVPAWLPFRMAWLDATGIGHMAAGAAIIAGILPRLAATMEAAMMSCFVVLLHLPRVIESPAARVEWTMLFIATAFSGAAWCLARTYQSQPWWELPRKIAMVAAD